MPGTLLILLEVSLLSRPAIMKDWPEPSSTDVSAVRVFNAGTPLVATEKSSDETVGRTRNEMRPSASTTGVNESCTPYCLNS